MRRLFALLFAGLSLLAGPAALAAGGTIQHKNVSLTYTAGHWGAAPNASLLGTDPGGANPLFRSGWWYRVAGADTREYPFPVPDTETYADGKLVATWANVDGKGFSARETTWVYDDERPSGGLVSELFVSWGTNTPANVALFHFLDVDVAGTFANDSAVLRGPGQIKISDGAALIRYRADNPQHYMVAPYDNLNGGEIKRRLNDAALDDLSDTGLPFGPGDVTAGYQFLVQGTYGSARVEVGSNVARDYVRAQGAYFGAQPGIFFRMGTAPDRAAFWVMRQTTQVQAYSSFSSGLEPLALNDFDGDAREDALYRQVSSGTLWMVSALTIGQIAGLPSLPPDVKVVATYDFNGDGRADILWRNAVTQKIGIWLMDGKARIGDRTPNPDQAAAANWEVVGAEDFDGDGDADLLWYNQTTGRLVIWYLDPSQVRVTGGFTDPPSVGSNVWRAVAVADFGRGTPSAPYGTPDILWQNGVSKKLVVWQLDFQGRRVAGSFTTPDGCGPFCQGTGDVFLPR